MALPEVDPANITALAAAYGITLTTAQVEGLPTLITKAQTLLPAATEQWVTDGRLTEALVSSVVEDMVVRVMRNPRAYRQVSIDDFSGTIDQAISSGLLYLSDDELARLTPATPRGHRLGTIRIGVLSHRLPQ
jgi:hypothetical protein